MAVYGLDVGAGRRSALSLPVDRLASEFFLMALNDATGSLRLTRRIAGLGVATAMIADLVMAGVLIVSPAGHLVPVSGSGPVDLWDREVLDWVSAEQPEPVAVWIDVLAGQAIGTVAQRLTVAGVIRPSRVRRPFRRSIVWRPVDANVAAWPWARLSTRIRRGERLGLVDTCLARLCLATGDEGRLLDGEPSGARQRLDRSMSPTPQVEVLFGQLSSAVGRAVLGGRI